MNEYSQYETLRTHWIRKVHGENLINIYNTSKESKKRMNKILIHFLARIYEVGLTEISV